jgi:quinol monooxygenase YgiN
MDALVERVTGVAEIFRQMPGHVAYYLVRSTGGTLMAIGIFTDRASAEASRQIAAKWVTENIADLLGAPSEVVVGDVVVMG